MFKRMGDLLVFVLIALIGAVISELIEMLFNPSISAASGWPDLFLLAVLVVLLVVTWFIAGTRGDLDKTRSSIEDTIRRTLDQIGTSVEYFDKDSVKDIFAREVEFIREAEREILMLVNLSVSPTVTPAEDVRREAYLRTLEEEILKHKASGFKYVRISQTPEDSSYPRFLPLTRKHFQRVFEMKEKHPALELEMMIVNTIRDFSFTIIDGNMLLIEVAAVRSAPSERYTIGYFAVSDRGGQLVRRFKEYFDRMERQARPLTLADLH